MLHVTIVVPDARFHEAFKNSCYFVGPQHAPYEIKLHTVVADPLHRTANLSAYIKQSLLELGLVDPEDVAYGPIEQVQLGWTKEDLP